jgi:hypothetical protein
MFILFSTEFLYCYSRTPIIRASLSVEWIIHGLILSLICNYIFLNRKIKQKLWCFCYLEKESLILFIYVLLCEYICLYAQVRIFAYMDNYLH